MAKELQALVEGHALRKVYRTGDGETVALDAASFKIMPRARVALMGPSGSGKSTLLHLIAALDTPTSGSIAWPALGSVETLRPAKIALAFQSPSLLAPLNVVENVEVPLLLNGVGDGQARTRALEALSLFHLDQLAEKLPEEISGGQAQRVALARVLAVGPRLIVADEPTGQLDHPTASQVFDALLDVLDRSDIALVVATHDSFLSNRMSDVWQMQHGRLETPQT
ncbi:MAG: ABC transporter ATP-binding protein [Candidatus Eremiobacteraeota bacterium]|nr:ABC transporter ATP-binding protein [Candidatus Eremiobacteraeota bacterium]